MSDATIMKRALRLARRGEGFVEPNPMVGCLVVRDQTIIGQGYHRRFGAPHAEVEALEDCRARGQDPAGADVFVTLEPCCHEGKTPPCTAALVAAGVGCVHVAMEDPFDLVSGRGIEALRRAGHHVRIGVCESEARLMNAPYLKRTANGLPWVITKWAQSVDGRIAAADGESRWISNERSRRGVHRLRARVDAILVGIGTVLADDPKLTARGVRLRRRARRVVLDPQLRLPLTAQLLQGADLRVTVATRQNPDRAKAARLAERGVEIIELPPADREGSLLAMRPLLNHLAQRHGATNVLAEGGGKIFGALFADELVDQVLVYVAPRIMADTRAVAAVDGLASHGVAGAPSLKLLGVKRIDGDVLLDYRVVRAEQGQGQGKRRSDPPRRAGSATK